MKDREVLPGIDYRRYLGLAVDQLALDVTGCPDKNIGLLILLESMVQSSGIRNYVAERMKEILTITEN